VSEETCPTAAYVHVPFCAHHCSYCDFAIAVGQDSLIELYLDALSLELSRLASPQPVRTLFLGGGTPTYLSPSQLTHLLRDVTRWLPVSGDYEFSIEANPGTLTREKVDILAKHGVTRVSLGVQSFQPHLLTLLERDHVPDDVPRAVEAIRARIPNLSIDLIFGVPGQTLSEWESDLAQGLALGPDHFSTYGLTYEKGTPLWKRREQGQVMSLDEDSELSMYARAMDVLEGAGFEQYEISNFARSRMRCRHNEVYWANESYHGFGMGAARYINGRRDLNVRDLRTYIRRMLDDGDATFQSEELGSRERAFETIGLNLRRREGIDRAVFRERTGFDLEALVGQRLSPLIEQKLLRVEGQHVQLTRQGKYVADAVIEELMRG
jgi:oxygen-independent coproporphyrinogen-3 oxidase